MLKLQFHPKYQINNLAVHTSWQAIPYNFDIFICEIGILKKGFSGWSKICLTKCSLRLKLCSRNLIFLLKWHCWIVKRFKMMLCESQLCIRITWNAMLKWLNFALARRSLSALCRLFTEIYCSKCTTQKAVHSFLVAKRLTWFSVKKQTWWLIKKFT